MSLYKSPIRILKKLDALRNNVFVGVYLDERKFTRISWNKMLAHRKVGDLEWSSLFTMNRAIHFKWVRCVFYIIKEIYHPKGVIRCSIPSNKNSVWLDIFKSLENLRFKDVSILPLCKKKLGDDELILFWYDIWLGDISLKKHFRRFYSLDLDNRAKVRYKLDNSI